MGHFLKNEINIIIARVKDKFHYYRFLSALRDFRRAKEKEDKIRFGSKFDRLVAEFVRGIRKK